jgi:CelD/BcsL family acetyltransferase involved in cellulose biosynthesis
VFQTPGWLEALRRTYGYKAVVLTTSAQGKDLTNGIVFCQVHSWLTGRRMVSLPFSDHCQPLAGSEEELESLLLSVERELDPSKWTYVEIRPVDLPERARTYLEKAESFYLHQLELTPSLEELFHGLHINCVQRKIRRAEREALLAEEGLSETLLQKFYALHVLTRRRQRLPPQPLVWFRNLIVCMGGDQLTIRVASKDGQPVASILTLRYKGTLTYKYGASDRRFSNLGGMQLLLWKAIEEAKRSGLSEFDMGRSDSENRGLIDFKRRWGAAQSGMTYLRYRPNAAVSRLRLARQIFELAPDGLIVTVGRALYRHFG